MDVKEKIYSFVLQAIYVDPDKIQDNSFLFKEGYFDSMGFLSLISFLEEEFKIEIIDNELLDENFESINAITDFVVRKLQ